MRTLPTNEPRCRPGRCDSKIKMVCLRYRAEVEHLSPVIDGMVRTQMGNPTATVCAYFLPLEAPADEARTT
jgi:hypothetical protein